MLDSDDEEFVNGAPYVYERKRKRKRKDANSTVQDASRRLQVNGNPLLALLGEPFLV
jgi:hypothetical protein